MNIFGMLGSRSQTQLVLRCRHPLWLCGAFYERTGRWGPKSKAHPNTSPHAEGMKIGGGRQRNLPMLSPYIFLWCRRGSKPPLEEHCPSLVSLGTWVPALRNEERACPGPPWYFLRRNAHLHCGALTRECQMWPEAGELLLSLFLQRVRPQDEGESDPHLLSFSALLRAQIKNRHPRS